MQNPFNTQSVKEATKSTTNAPRLGFGIIDNCVMTAVTIDSSKNGNKFIDFVFEKPETGEWDNLRVWYPNGDANPREGETQDQANYRDITSRLSHIVAILEVFLSPEEASIQATNFDEFAIKAKNKLGNRFEGIKVRLKRIYDTDGVYAEFPRFPGYVEKQVEGVNSALKFSKWELENRCTPSNNGSIGGSSSNSSSTSNTNSEFDINGLF